MQAIIFAIISFLGWGIGDIPGTIASQKIGAFSAIFWGILTGLILSSFYIPFALHQLINLTPGIFSLCILLTVLFYVSDVIFTEAVVIGNPSVVGSISFSFTALVVIFSVFFLKESITIYQILVIIMIFIGVILSSLDWQYLSKGKIFKDKGILLAVITMLSWGVYFTFIKIPVKAIGWFWPTYTTFLLVPLFWLFMKKRGIKLQKINYKNAFWPIILGSVLVRMAEFSFNIAIDHGMNAIVAPIAGSSPVLFTPLAYFFFKDKIDKQQILGIIITVIGIVLLSFMSR